MLGIFYIYIQRKFVVDIFNNSTCIVYMKLENVCIPITYIYHYKGIIEYSWTKKNFTNMLLLR